MGGEKIGTPHIAVRKSHLKPAQILIAPTRPFAKLLKLIHSHSSMQRTSQPNLNPRQDATPHPQAHTPHKGYTRSRY